MAMHELEEPIQDDKHRHAQSDEKLRALREEVRALKWMVEQAKERTGSSGATKRASR
jgi:hypothetical protein